MREEAENFLAEGEMDRGGDEQPRSERERGRRLAGKRFRAGFVALAGKPRRFAFPRGAEIHSFWGHENTLAAANAFFGEDLTPKSARPALALSENLLPMLDGLEFRECWVFSPNYAEVGRPALGEEVSAVKIKSWTLLKITWE